MRRMKKLIMNATIGCDADGYYAIVDRGEGIANLRHYKINQQTAQRFLTALQNTGEKGTPVITGKSSFCLYYELRVDPVVSLLRAQMKEWGY